MRKRIAFIALCGYLAFNSFAPIVHAQSTKKPFSASIESSYAIQEDGSTQVTHGITLTNNSPTQFIKQFALQVQKAQVTQVVALANQKVIKPEVVEGPLTTTITLEFPDTVVGQEKQRSFSISYQTPSLAVISPSTLEVRIPQFALPDGPIEVTKSTTRIIVPEKYQNPVHVSPEQFNIQKDPQTTTLTFLQEHSASAIVAFFGDKQHFTVEYSATLINDSDTTTKAQVALPPDTSWQRINYELLEPLPESLTKDLDGNWIATYPLTARQQLPVRFRAQVTTALNPFTEVPVVAIQPAHTQSDTYWDTAHPDMIALASNYTSPESIHTFTVDHLRYPQNPENIQGRTRKGAVLALQQTTDAVCQEFSDVFVTLARTNSIPARRVTGFAYNANRPTRPTQLQGAALHAWPEYFDRSHTVWRPTDPTWQYTTGGQDYFHQFDLNHISFAINGISSTLPTPIGLAAHKDEKLEVTLTQPAPAQQLDATVTVTPRSLFGWTIPGEYAVTVQNNTGTAWYQLQLRSTDPLLPIFDLPAVLPWQTSTSYISITTPTSGPVQLRLSAAQAQDIIVPDVFQLTTSHQFISFIINTPGWAALAFCGTFATTTAGCLLVFRYLKHRPVRR